MTISIERAIKEGAAILREANVEDARREAASLLADLLERDRAFLIAHSDDFLSDLQYQTFRDLVARRARGEPLQYITGHREFFGLDFEVSPAVLIPRPETELVVEAAIELCRDDSAPAIADIGTGSGCIAISILHELKTAEAVATDISLAGLEVAQRNAERHGVDRRLTLVQSDGFRQVPATKRFSLIVSNPPYVSDAELAEVSREVRFEPRTALAGGKDGLLIIERLLNEARPFVRLGGYFIFEIGFGQSELVEKLIDTELWRPLEVRADLQGIPRTFILQGI
ncbi:MAG: peptide chain release factor N(5)-glutamine methyltransferase [Acidobacteriota bacterium]